MSMAVKRAKFQGDPGLFGFLGGIAKKGLSLVGAAGIPGISAGARLASKGLSAVLGAKARAPMVVQQQAMLGGGGQGFRVPQNGAARLQFASQRQLGPGPGPGPGRNGTTMARTPRGSQREVIFVGQRGECPAGFRPNKSGYWVTSPMGTASFVEPGERCVRRRRRNPLNPRALDRAMSRVISANKIREKLKGWPTGKKC